MRRVLVLSAIAALAPPAAAEARDFPRDFLWGTAISGFQTEAGGRPTNADRRSDWWVWSHDRPNIEADRVSGDPVEGYFAWSLVDNFEWAAGYYPRFGFFSYDPDTLARGARPSARLFRRIARSGNLP